MDEPENKRLIEAAVATTLGDEVVADPEEVWLARFRDATLLVLAVVAHAHEISAKDVRRATGQWPISVRLSLRSLCRVDLLGREYRPGPDYWFATAEGTRLGVVPYVTRLLGAARPRYRGLPLAGWSAARFRFVGTTHGPPIFSPAYTLAHVTDPDVLSEAIRTGTHDDRAYALTKLVALRDPASVDILCEVAQERGKEEPLARQAVIALGTFASPTSIGALIDVAAHRDSILREAAARSLGRLHATEAIPTLIDLLDYPSEPVRAAAVLGLARIGDPSVAPALASALNDPDGRVRRCTLDALVRLGAVDQLQNNPNRARPLRSLDARRARAVAERHRQSH